MGFVRCATCGAVARREHLRVPRPLTGGGMEALGFVVGVLVAVGYGVLIAALFMGGRW